MSHINCIELKKLFSIHFVAGLRFTQSVDDRVGNHPEFW